MLLNLPMLVKFKRENLGHQLSKLCFPMKQRHRIIMDPQQILPNGGVLKKGLPLKHHPFLGFSTFKTIHFRLPPIPGWRPTKHGAGANDSDQHVLAAIFEVRWEAPWKFRQQYQNIFESSRVIQRSIEKNVCGVLYPVIQHMEHITISSKTVNRIELSGPTIKPYSERKHITSKVLSRQNHYHNTVIPI